MDRSIAIIGCGVSGLTTGIVLQEAGWQVTIFTKALPADTTSAVAAAIWFPYAVNPRDKVARWSSESFLELEQLSRDPNSGVVMIPLTVLIRREEDAWWKEALPPSHIRKASPEELPEGFSLGYRTTVPLTETPVYLPYLHHRFKAAGGIVEKHEVKHLNELTSKSLHVINCAGLQAGELTGDTSLYPIRGQILLAAPLEGMEAMSADFAFDPAEEELAYIIPRRDGIVLGGTAQKDNQSLVTDTLTSRDILERCARLDTRVRDIQVRKTLVGLRPGRPEIRLEKQGNVIHNYGHGGGGYTVSWGCAFEVRDLIMREEA